MTTITNFINANFIVQQADSDQEVPIWVLTAPPATRPRLLLNHLIAQCETKNKPLVHLDLGLSSLRTHNLNASSLIKASNGMEFLVSDKKPYYLLKWGSKERSDKECLTRVFEALSQFPKVLGEKDPKSLGLIVEGLELLATLPHFSQQLEAFISNLSNLNRCFRQITIVTFSDTLSPEHRFALERISTCLTNLQDYQQNQQKWTCLSTVRRYTGFSNEEKYEITNWNGKCKVEKWVPPKAEGETEAQKEMVSSLGFVVKKDENARKQQEDMKKLIYPHLRIQESCECGKASCQCSQEDLIVLDDEQEDDDDIDV